eukprot:COSAG02_NODE_31250_length_536_cov_2.524027_1_plen_109_part_00
MGYNERTYIECNWDALWRLAQDAIQTTSCANRHKADPGNIMQPSGTKVGRVGTKLLQTWYQKVYHMVPKLQPSGTKVAETDFLYKKDRSCAFPDTNDIDLYAQHILSR